MSRVDLTRLRSVGHVRTKGQAQVQRLVEGGKTRGFEVSYGDGRQEAIVRPETVRARFSVSRQEEDHE